EDISGPRSQTSSSRSSRNAARYESESSQYSYEDEDQSADSSESASNGGKKKGSYTGPIHNSIGKIAEFFASIGKKLRVTMDSETEPVASTSFKPGQHVRHPKYGEGIVYRREGEGSDAKITVQFQVFGLKKLVEKYAQLERS